MSSIVLQPAHGAVLMVAVGGALVHNMWMSLKVGKARKQFKIPYPVMYAESSHKDANAFNCVQRAHQNSLENLPTFYMMLLTAGARYPALAAVAGAVYLAGKVSYFNGYSTGEPKNRMRGSYAYFGTFALLGATCAWAVELIRPAVGL